MKTIFASIFFVSLVTHADEGSVEPFLQRFVHTATITGSCDFEVSGYFGHNSLRLGSFYFPEVHGGPNILDDDLVRLETKTVLSRNKIVTFSTMLTKTSGTVSTRTETATLAGQRLTLTSKSTSRSPGEAPFVAYSDVCVYKVAP